MKKNILFKILIVNMVLACFNSIIIAQTTVTLQPDSAEGKDSRINSAGLYTSGTDHELVIQAWTFSGTPGIDRGLVEFDLSSIPQNATILNASLYLYGAPDLSTGPHSQLSGSNELVVRRITGAWNEHNVTWSNQPPSTSVNEIVTTPSASANQDYVIAVTTLIQDMIDNPTNSHGFLLKLLTESHYRRVNFYSSDYTIAQKRPKLVLTYDQVATSISEQKFKENLFEIYPNPANNILQISTSSKVENSKLDIYTIDGKLMLSQDNISEHTMLDISTWSLGTYLVKVSTPQGFRVGKLIKN